MEFKLTDVILDQSALSKHEQAAARNQVARNVKWQTLRNPERLGQQWRDDDFWTVTATGRVFCGRTSTFSGSCPLKIL